ncbi:MAG: prephenate dehydrogenase [Chloroflexi bacterium]|nr:prephenate dehydrogenase [Chloroflexota bacterium]
MKDLAESTVAIVGLGLMGGSLALALRERQVCRRILAVTRDGETRRAAVASGSVDAAGADLRLAGEADLVVLATPVRNIKEQMRAVGAVAKPGAIVMDLGSTKREVTQALVELPAGLEPIGAHPMCGKETSGFGAAEAALYRNAVFVLTPLERTAPETVAWAQALVSGIGARPLLLAAERHDEIVGTVSHLPYLVAVALMATADDQAGREELLYTLAASGFRDTTRVAAKETAVMLDILLTNKDNVAPVARACAANLAKLAELLESADEGALRQYLEAAAVSRRSLFPRQRPA